MTVEDTKWVCQQLLDGLDRRWHIKMSPKGRSITIIGRDGFQARFGFSMKTAKRKVLLNQIMSKFKLLDVAAARRGNICTCGMSI